MVNKNISLFPNIMKIKFICSLRNYVFQENLNTTSILKSVLLDLLLQYNYLKMITNKPRPAQTWCLHC